MNAIRLFNSKICNLINKFRIIMRLKNLNKDIIFLDCLENVQNQMGMILTIFIKNLELKITELQ